MSGLKRSRWILRKRHTLLLLVSMLGTGTLQAHGQTAVSLPGGASSTQESFNDWQVTCSVIKDQARPVCLMSQVQTQNGQRLLSIELFAQPDGKSARGTAFLPFGMVLDEGVTFKVDPGSDLGKIRFSTCLPVGCVVPLNLQPNALAAMRRAGALKLAGVSTLKNQPVALSVSLNGFSAALDRAIQLSLGK